MDKKKTMMIKGCIYTQEEFKDRVGYHDKYIYTCNICSRDKELWPYGSIFQYKFKVKQGCTSCGCSKNIRWTEEQYRILVVRRCSELNYSFGGFVDNPVKSKTKLKLTNNATGCFWDTTEIKTFLSGVEDPNGKNDKISRNKRKPDTVMIDKFMSSGKYHEDTIFKRNLVKVSSQGRKSYWDVICGECGIPYTSGVSQLYAGKRGCDCKGGGGFDRNKSGYIYLCRWFNEDKSYLKFGITNFTVETRTRYQQYKSNLSHEVLHTFHCDDGYILADLEQYIKDSYRDKIKACPKKLLPDGYTETLPFSNEIISEVLQIIKSRLNLL